MTPASKPPDATDLSRVPRVVLEDDGLDRLELVLGGWLPPSALSAPPPGEQLVLTDAENTPLALVIGGATSDGLLDRPAAGADGPRLGSAVGRGRAPVRRCRAGAPR